MPLPVCSRVRPVPITVFRRAWVHALQSRWVQFWACIWPLKALVYTEGFDFCFDGHFCWVNETPYELVYFAKGRWWVLHLIDCKTGKKESVRILFSQLSKRDRWQLCLLFQLYRMKF